MFCFIFFIEVTAKVDVANGYKSVTCFTVQNSIRIYGLRAIPSRKHISCVQCLGIKFPRR